MWVYLVTYLDKTFCASPNCQNDCGRRMTLEEHERLIYLNDEGVSYGYFCGDDDTAWKDPQSITGILINGKRIVNI